MAAGQDEVHLIAVEAVAAGYGEQDEQRDAADRPDGQRQPEQLAAHADAR
ncbi:MAG: hypothetical protein ACHQ01_03105 [Candidatus Limnocylindrales bacterium]